MYICRICQSKEYINCAKCTQSQLQIKNKLLSDMQKQMVSNQREIEKYINHDFQLEKERLMQTHQSMYSLKRKSYLKKMISKKFEQNRAKKQNLKISQSNFQKRQKIIDQMKKQQRQILSHVEATKFQILNIQKQLNTVRQKNSLKINGKVKDIQNSLINQQDKLLIDNALQIKKSQQKQINLAYEFMNLLDLVQHQSIQLKNNEKFMNYRDVRAINRSVTMLACLARIFDLWLPHQVTLQNSTFQIKGESLISGPYSKVFGLHKLKVNLKFLNLLQADIQFLARSINYEEKPFMCFSKKFIRTISVKQNITGQRQTKNRLKQDWQSLKAQAIQKLTLKEIDAYDSCLPPLHPINSNSQKDENSDSEYQQLI